MTERFYNFPVSNRIVASAPTRIDLAGGTIDIWPLYLFHPGAQTLNAAISIRARARVESRADNRIVIRSEDTGVTVEADDWKELRDRRELRLLSLLVHFFETRGITLTTSSQSPAGAGIAGSSALNVAVCAALSQWKRVHYEPEALLHVAQNRPSGFRIDLCGPVDLDVGVRGDEFAVGAVQHIHETVLVGLNHHFPRLAVNLDIRKHLLVGAVDVVDVVRRVLEIAHHLTGLRAYGQHA